MCGRCLVLGLSKPRSDLVSSLTRSWFACTIPGREGAARAPSVCSSSRAAFEKVSVGSAFPSSVFSPLSDASLSPEFLARVLFVGCAGHCQGPRVLEAGTFS